MRAAASFACAVLGGLLASSFWTVPLWQRVLMVLLGAAVGAVAAYLPLAARRPEPRQPAASPVRPSPPSSADAEPSPLVAQCPRCGSFRLDLSERDSGYAFGCRDQGCGHTWSWTPGAPWPAIVVRRDLADAGPADRHETREERLCLMAGTAGRSAGSIRGASSSCSTGRTR